MRIFKDLVSTIRSLFTPRLFYGRDPATGRLAGRLVFDEPRRRRGV